MVDWAALRDAYGSAEGIPELLASAETGSDDAWNDVYGRLCHQGSVYSASFAALPELSAMATGWKPPGTCFSLHLASAIIASTDRPAGFENVRTEYQSEIVTLRDLAQSNLALADGPIDFAYALQSLMAFENVPVWQNHLDWIASEEAQLECPSCSEDLEIALGDSDFSARTFTGASRPVTPADPNALVDGEIRVYELAVAHAQREFAERVLYLFGDTTCPSCEQTFSIPEALSADYS